MHIAPVDPHTSAVSHGGERYVPDADGLFDVPQELAERLLAGPGWEIHVKSEPDATLDLDELRAIAAKGVEAARLLEEAEAAEAAAKAAEEEAAKADNETGEDAGADDEASEEEAAEEVADEPELPIEEAAAPAKKTRTRAPKAE